MFKYIIVTLIYFAVLFLLKILIPLMRFQDKYLLIVNLYNMSQEIVKTATEYGENVSIAEVELEYKRYHIVFSNMYELYNELEKKCCEAIEYYNRLGEFIISKNVYLKERNVLNELQNLIAEKKCASKTI